ncbi:MBL fold metallo-hydrolase [Candidatus Uhrbacteria bacterium]|nr:MBL fold metallo-hydrolase [Candidatus Uhrbacteria bacterium]
MKVTFCGAAREVTGSCHLVQTDNSRVLLDCGMFQGSAFADAKNFRDFCFDPKSIDVVVVTHAHLDHIGRLPKLVKEGFKGKIYMTPPTAKLAKLVLEDAEQVMEDEYRRNFRPKLFEREDVDRTVAKIVLADYSRRVKLDGLSFRYRDAGHILGSAFIEMDEADGPRIAFSGDLGNVPDQILKPTAQLAGQDVLIVESTYGNRLHEKMETREIELRKCITETLKQNGVLLIPAFAIERTQLLLFELNHLVENRLIPPVDIYLDSPLAIKASAVMQEFPEDYNKTALRQVAGGDDLFVFPGLHKTLSRDDSKIINEAPRPKVIIAGSGMMNGGRILHHLIRYLSDKRSTVLIIGYQADGTLGRRLYEGDKRVEVLGERVEVKAKIKAIGSYSAHADQRQIMDWIKSAEKLPSSVYCVHGDEGAAVALATRLKEDLKIPAEAPKFDETIEI